MVRRWSLWLLALGILPGGGPLAQHLALSGRQEARLTLTVRQELHPPPGATEMVVSFVVPRGFTSPTVRQRIANVSFDLDPRPDHSDRIAKPHASDIAVFTWRNPAGTLQAAMRAEAEIGVVFPEAELAAAPFPFPALPDSVRPFLTGTALVQIDDPAIRALARDVTVGAATAREAIEAILRTVSESLDYVLQPSAHDASTTLSSGVGNCQNYSHLAAALFRVVGIPARIVNGVTAERGYGIDLGSVAYDIDMAAGRHSWIEIFLPETGWVPVDPQQSAFFVSSRYLRIEAGIDNAETVWDGLVRWRGGRGVQPTLRETVVSDFLDDVVAITGRIRDPNWRTVFLSPDGRTPVLAAAPPPPPSEPAPDVDYTALDYSHPVTIGNFDFPEGMDFSGFRPVEGSGASRQRFLVESAEYLTGPRRFAQMVVLTEPLRLTAVGMALHHFGGTGRLWVTLAEDGDGTPGAGAVASVPIATTALARQPGYRWVDFDFAPMGIVLSPGRYWIVLHHDGAPIVNGFYSYGKVSAPADGTRSRPAAGGAWDRIHAFEFNYRIRGLGVAGAR